MGAKVSAEMLAARKLIEKGTHTAYAAAKQCNISQGAISKSQWYKDFIAAGAKKRGKKK